MWQATNISAQSDISILCCTYYHPMRDSRRDSAKSHSMLSDCFL